MKKKISGLLVAFSVRFLILALFPFSLTVHKPLLYIAAFNFSSLYLAAPRYLCTQPLLILVCFFAYEHLVERL